MRRLSALHPLIIASLLLTVLWLPSIRAAEQPAPNNQYQPHQVILGPQDLQAAGTKTLRWSIPASLDPARLRSQVAPTAAPAPFSDLLVRWQAQIPEGASLTLEVRASADGATWTDWQELGINEDMHDPSDPPGTHWSVPVYAGRSSFWQIRTSAIAAPDGGVPTIQEIEVNTVDVGETPVEERPQFRAATTGPLGLPPLYTRVDWGSPDGQGSRQRPEYRTATHMVVHHTAEYNMLKSHEFWWGDRVRAIWSFHTYSRRMGDIGYNFLIDPEGNLYEGRAGASPNFTSDPVAFHDTGNYGSMGVALIGNFEQERPTEMAQERLVDVLAWKAAQRHIDPFGSSYYEGCRRSSVCSSPGDIVPHIAGHRDVTNDPPNYTSCPGGLAHDLLDEIRLRVAHKLWGAPAPASGEAPLPTPVPRAAAAPAARSSDQDEGPRQITGNTHWNAAQGPIMLDRDHVVPAGSVLTIEPGVEVRAAPHVQLLIRGVLRVEGAPGAPVRFAASNGRWRGIALEEGAIGHIERVEIRGAGDDGHAIIARDSTLVVKEAIIVEGGGGIVAGNSSIDIQQTIITGNDLASAPALQLRPGDGQPLRLRHSLIAGNQMPPGSAAVQIRTPQSGATLLVEHNLIIGETGPNLRIDAAAPYAAHITCNTFSGGTFGMQLTAPAKEDSGYALTIRDNVFQGHRNRGVVSDLAFDLRWNWWDSPSGPHDPAGNAQATGNAVDSKVVYNPWLTERPACAPQP